MTHSPLDDRTASSSPRPRTSGGIAVLDEQAIPGQYELLLGKLARAERDLELAGDGGTSASLEEASSIVFELLYSLDFKRGGELVPRLAALYGYIGNELMNVARTGDRVQLGHIRDMITTLRQSWYGQTVS